MEDIRKVGGRVFFIDETSDEEVKFYDKEGREIEIKLGDMPFGYRIVKAGKKPKFWVYTGKTDHVSWGEYGTKLDTSEEFGKGFENTEKILASGKGGICEYISKLRESTGLDDWFIGSLKEMDKLREFLEKFAEELCIFNLFDHDWIWASSENSSVNAWLWLYYPQYWYYGNKNTTLSVVGVRAF